MLKFSIIIPVYNSEVYLKRVVDSILEQSFSDFEAIFINDGSKDKSLEILKEYEKTDKRIKVFTQSNKGLSSARNKGVSKARAEYLIFLDSDDYLDEKALETINDSLEKDLDLLRFQITDVIKGNTYPHPEENFETMSGPSAFKKIVKFKYVEPAVCYAYNRKFYLKNKFKFIDRIYHEDFALIPLIIMKAKTVKIIDSCLYYYVKNEDSIMTSKDYQKKLKKFDDAIIGYKYLIDEIDKLDLKNQDVFKSYIANAIIIKLKDLKKKDYHMYLEQLEKLNIFDNMLRDKFSRKIKYYLIKLNPRFYLKYLYRK